MLELILGLVLIIAGTYFFQKKFNVRPEDMNLMYAGYFLVKGTFSLATFLTGLMSGTFMGGVLLMIAIDAAFGYYSLKRANVL